MLVDSLLVYSYLLVTLVAGLVCAKKIHTFKDFSIAHRKYNTPTIVATLLATVIGGGSTFGVSAKTFQYGLIFLFAFYGFVVNRLLVARFIVPKLALFQGKLSVGDILYRYYGSNGKIVAGVFAILVSLGSVGTQCLAVGYVMHFFLGIHVHYGVIIASGIFIFYAALGGMRSIVITDVIQSCIFLIVLPIIFFIALKKTGGLFHFFQEIPESKLFVQDPSTLFTASNFFLILIFGSFDPSFIQRILMARDMKQAQTSVRIVGYLSFFILTIMGLSGISSFILNPQTSGQWNLLFLVQEMLPTFLQGLAVSGLLAALMSTADSDLNCVGISAVNDVMLPLLKKNLSEGAKILWARLFTIFFGVFSVCTALYLEDLISIMKFAFSFWGPTVIVPLVFGLYGRVMPKKQFTLLSIFSVSLVLFWNVFLSHTTHIDGFLVGSAIVFVLCLFKGRMSHAHSQVYSILS